MNKLYALLLVSLFSGCVVVPEPDLSVASDCGTSSKRMKLTMVDLAEETGSYRNADPSGLFTVPVTGVISGAIVGVNNVYNITEEKFMCNET